MLTFKKTRAHLSENTAAFFEVRILFSVKLICCLLLYASGAAAVLGMTQILNTYEGVSLIK